FLQGNRGHRRRSDRHSHVPAGPRAPTSSGDSFQNKMNHDEIRELLHAYADGELDLINAREIEQHLRRCDECRGAEGQIRALRKALTSDSPSSRAPAHLRRKINAAVRREAKETTFSPWLAFAVGEAGAVIAVEIIFFQ